MLGPPGDLWRVQPAPPVPACLEPVDGGRPQERTSGSTVPPGGAQKGVCDGRDRHDQRRRHHERVRRLALDDQRRSGDAPDHRGAPGARLDARLGGGAGADRLVDRVRATPAVTGGQPARAGAGPSSCRTRPSTSTSTCAACACPTTAGCERSSTWRRRWRPVGSTRRCRSGRPCSSRAWTLTPPPSSSRFTTRSSTAWAASPSWPTSSTHQRRGTAHLGWKTYRRRSGAMPRRWRGWGICPTQSGSWTTRWTR